MESLMRSPKLPAASVVCLTSKKDFIYKVNLMKQFIYLLLAVCITGTQLSSCKGKDAGTNKDTTTVSQDTSTPAPVVIAPDTTLNNSVRDATKDYPGVNASVNNGEVTLTGKIKRERLPKLMESIQASHPKKVNNNLTIEP
ncbi:MAG: hypothetical protein JWN76_1924 [Chitinophagaceae bacterium]|nr:hypothetical protein [Chitinophagaceae bacterium]